MIAIVRIAVLLCAVLLAACYPTTREPIGSTGAMTADARLVGGWKAINEEAKDEPTFLFFLRRDADKLECLLVTADKGDKKGEWMSFEALTGKAGAHAFLNGRTLLDDGKKPADANTDWTPVHYRFDADGTLRLFTLDEKAIGAAIKKGEIKGEIKEGSLGDEVRITAEAKAVDAFFAGRDPKTVFKQTLGVYRRLK